MDILAKRKSPETSFCLLAKLLPPRSSQQAISRERLIKRMLENKSNLAIVIAEAGYGKTTLIADFVQKSGKNFVWYQLDQTDSDVSVFLTYLVQGIRRIIPRFGKRILQYVKKAPEEISLFPERAADLFLNEVFESATFPFYLVLDDYHTIEATSPVHKIVSRILKYTPETLNVLITTRDLPPLQPSSIYLPALLITAEELAFNNEEIKTLFKKYIGIELKDEDVAKLREITEGWATALQLILQSAQQERESKLDFRKALQKTRKDIFQYFAEEVFLKESPNFQRALLFLSLFKDNLTIFCRRVFPEIYSKECLENFQKKSIFVNAVEEKEVYYRIHPLFRDFLQHKFRKDFGDEFLKESFCKIADFLYREKMWEDSIEYFLKGEEFGKALEILKKIADDLLGKGRLILLGSLLSDIPEEILLKTPELLLKQAEALRLQGKTEESLKVLRKATKVFSKKGDKVGRAEALCIMAGVLRKQSRVETAMKLIKEIEELHTDDEGSMRVRMKAENTKGLCYISLGMLQEAEACFNRTLRLAEELSDEKFIKIALHNLALPSAFRGDFENALRLFRKILDESEPFPQQAIGHLNIARLHIFRGELTEAESELNKALKICNDFNIKDLLAEILEAFGNIHREKGDYQKSLEFYERAKKIYVDLGLNLSSKSLMEEEAKLYLSIGWHSKAQALLEKLTEERKKRGNELSIKIAQFLLAYARAAQNDLEALDNEVEKLRLFFNQKELSYDEAQSSLLISRIYFAKGKKDKAFEFLRRTLNLVEKFGYEYWFLSEMKTNREFFTNDEIKAILPPHLSQHCKIESKTVRVELQTSEIFDLYLKTFGSIEARRLDSKPIPYKAWITKRARDIFFFIATSKNRRATKDILIETFWEGESLETAEKNFHPTISYIRKALNWGQDLKINFLSFNDGTYYLNPEISFWIDSEEFEKRIAEASKARSEGDTEKVFALLIEAAEIYKGEFMPGVYENWAEERRSYFEEQHIKLLSSLAKLSASRKDFASAIKYAEQALQKDSLREDMYRLLMRIYALQGKKALAVKCFNKLKETLKKELGVNPSPETIKLFKELFD